MALIICPECGQTVSDKAEICPHCGIKIAGYVNTAQPAQQTATPPVMAERTSVPATASTGESASAPGPGKGGKGWKIMLVSFLLAAVAVGVGYYYYADAQSQKEQRDYENAMRSNDQLVMQMYLQRYGEAPAEHRDSVGLLLSLLEQEAQEWHNTVVNASRGALEEYIKTHPDSPHKREAMSKIDSIDYARAERENTTVAFENYLKQHPDGHYAGEAQDFLQEKAMTTVQPEEAMLTRTVIRRFFQAVNARDESKLLSTVMDVMDNFLNHVGAANSDAVEFMNKLYKADVTNLNWHILDDFKVEKVKNDDGTANIKASFSADLDLERTDDTKEKHARYLITSEVTPEGKITKLNMKKLPRTAE